MSLIFSIWTVLVMIAFIGIVIWTWSKENKSKYEAAARIPLEDDDDLIAGKSGDSENG